MKLHVGGLQRHDGWTILNVQPGLHVDLVGSVTDLSGIDSGSCSTVYASHVLEHLSAAEFGDVLKEFRRILVAGGLAKISVPDLGQLCRLFANARLTADERWQVQRMIFGGQTDPFDFHKIGLTWEFLLHFAHEAGFQQARQVRSFGLFDDTSELVYHGIPVSLNVELS